MLRIIWLVSNHKLVKIYNLVKCMGILCEENGFFLTKVHIFG